MLTTILLCASVWFSLLVLVTAANLCSPELCNYAGECQLVNNKPNCSCYKETFEGKYCEIVKDLCETERNVCDNKRSCLWYVGQTICDCADSASGHDCTRSVPVLATKAMCIYNLRAEYAKMEIILVSFEDLGSIPLKITVSTPTYMIAQVPQSDFVNSSRRLYTNDLEATAKQLGIRLHARLPYKAAHYYIFNSEHFSLGTNELTVRIESSPIATSEKREMKPYVHTLALNVHVVRMNAECVPNVRMRWCMNPDRPMKVDIERFANFKPIIERRCIYPDQKLRVQWVIYDYAENVIFYESDVRDYMILKIPRYHLWFDNWLNRPDTLLVVQLKLWETDRHMARCYINVTALPVLAVIAGGDKREVNAGQTFIIDGSQSLEPARNPKVDQMLIYKWSCTSKDDPNNSECRNYMGNTPTIQILGGKLRAGVKYLYQLKIQSQMFASRWDKVEQEISVLEKRSPLQVDIECVRNCKLWHYNTGHRMHLLAVCKNCEQPIYYKWFINDEDMKINKKRFVKEIEYSGDISIRLEVTSEDKFGSIIRLLRTNLPPANGTCSIEPSHGLECKTTFRIKCQNFDNDDQGSLMYIYGVGNETIDIVNSEETSLYLFDGGQVKVDICDMHFSCTVRFLSFTVEQMDTSGSINTFFSRYNLKRMLSDGPRQQAFCVLFKLSRYKVPPTYRLERIYEQIEGLHSKTVLELVWSFKIASNFLNKLRPIYNYRAHILTVMFERVRWTFKYVQIDTEVRDLLDQHYLELCHIVTNVMNQLCKQVEHVHKELMRNDFEGPYSDDDPDWETLDPSVATRIGNYLDLDTVVQRIINRVGMQGPYYVDPGDLIVVNQKYVTFSVKVYEDYSPIQFSTEDLVCNMLIPLASISALRKHYKTNELLLQSLCFRENPFWWAPEVFNPTSAIFSVDFFSKDMPDEKISGNHSIYLELKEILNNTDMVYSEMTDELHSNIVIYRTQIEPHANLVVRFVRTSADLRVLLTLNKYPSFDMLKQNGILVPNTSTNKTLIMHTNCTLPETAYMAIIPYNQFINYANFTFRMSAQECCIWDQSKNDPNWIANFSYAQSERQDPEYYRCKMFHLSTLSAKEYPIRPFPVQKGRRLKQILPLNVPSVLFFCGLILFTLALVFYGMTRRTQKHQNLIRVIGLGTSEVPVEDETIIVHIRTGGVLLARTSSHVKLVFKSALGRYRVDIFQDPLAPHLQRNTSCLLRLSNKRVQLPCLLTISLNHSGQYPNWYCRSIQIDDLTRDVSHTFPIHAWVKRYKKLRVSCYSDEENARFKFALHQPGLPPSRWQGFKHQFRYFVKFYFTNWFWTQPVFGPWRYADGSLNKFERICVYICKILITITIVFCYYQKSTATNYYDFQHSTGAGYSEALGVAIVSYFINILFDVLIYNLAHS